MSADGTELVNLTNNPAFDCCAAWSRDGTKIAFFTRRDGNTETYVMNADGSGQLNPTRNPAADGGPVAWSPDGAKIAFMSDRDGDRDGDFDIYVMNADGSGVRQLTTSTGYAQYPAWRPQQGSLAQAPSQRTRSR